MGKLRIHDRWRSPWSFAHNSGLDQLTRAVILECRFLKVSPDKGWHQKDMHLKWIEFLTFQVAKGNWFVYVCFPFPESGPSQKRCGTGCHLYWSDGLPRRHKAHRSGLTQDTQWHVTRCDNPILMFWYSYGHIGSHRQRGKMSGLWRSPCDPSLWESLAHLNSGYVMWVLQHLICWGHHLRNL